MTFRNLCCLFNMGLTPPPLNNEKKTAELVEGHPLRRGVISDVQLSCTETRFQKGTLSGKNGSKTQCYQYLWLAM